MTKEECFEIREEMIHELRQVTCKYLEKLDEHSDEETIRRMLQMIFEASGYEHGYIEGMAALMGAARSDRDSSRRMTLALGKKEALQNHSESCDGCEATEDLKKEIQAS